jgi:hypothetical protein
MGKKGVMRSQVAKIDEFVPYPVGAAEKGHSLKAPVGYIDEILYGKMRGRQVVSEIILRYEIKPCPAVGTEKKAVGLLQSHRGAALGTLMFDFPGRGVRSFHRTDCNKRTLEDFPWHSEGIFLNVAFPPPVAHNGYRILRWEQDSYRIERIVEKRAADGHNQDRI